jgi:glycosyl transferase family 25
MSETPKIYILNLNMHPARLEAMQNHLNGLDLEWERVEAIDALETSEDELNKYTDSAGPIQRMGSGARACTVGHFKIWERFLDMGKPAAFILEDDIKVSRHFFAFIEEASRLVDDVDVLNFNRQNSRRAQKN